MFFGMVIRKKVSNLMSIKQGQIFKIR